MFFGHVAACHLSGYETLQLTEDELLTATKSMRWFVDNCWQQQADGSWQSPYASASDLTVHAWSGDPGIFGQGIAGLELVKDYPKAKKILDWWKGTTDEWHPPDRWMPRRPD